MSEHTDICYLTAKDMARKIRARELSATEVMAAHLTRIEQVNPKVNAIVTLAADQAMDGARLADAAIARGEPVGRLHGLPIAFKDLHDTKGIRTTYGSPLFKDYIPQQDALIVERIKKAGGILIGKTNTPEFGAGSQTFNAVFGSTLNPYDVTKTCGGSSGGAAVALACGMSPIAEGSDMGGSLRNPAAFCNVVGLRTAPGRVPVWPAMLGWSTLSVAGPMARTVADAALLLSVISGPDDRSPIALQDPGEMFARPLERDFGGVRIAWAKDLGGVSFDRRIKTVIEQHRKTFGALGCIIEEAEPDFTDADEIFRVLRAWCFASGMLDIPLEQRKLLKDTVLQELDTGARLSGLQIGRAEIKRTQLYQRVRMFFEKYEYFILPVTQVPPFDVRQPYVTDIEGVKLLSYIDWMKSCFYISVAGNPAISVPAGFTDDGLPVGIQIVGRHRDEWSVLQLANAFENAAQCGKRKPGIVQIF